MPNLISRLYNFVDDANNGVPITALRVDSELNQLVNTQNQAVIIAATAPVSPINGELWIDSSNKFLKQYRNSEWVIMGVVHYGTVMATPQSGDVWIDNSGGEIVYNVRNKANTAWIAMAQATSLPTTSTGLLPSGVILMWSGSIASIPTGFFLCNGSNGTPDLRNKFIVCADADVVGIAKSTVSGSASQSGGSTTITQANLPNVSLGTFMQNGGASYSRQAGGASNTADVSVSLGGSGTVYTQPYYALAYIMKS